MNCGEARLHIGAQPAALPQAAAEHVAGCAGCGRILQDALALEQDLVRALSGPPPVLAQRLATSAKVAALPKRAATTGTAAAGTRSGAAPVGATPRRFMAQRWALAASLVFAAAIGVFLWTGRPADTLAADVVAHMAGEATSWSQTRPLAQSEVDRVLAQAGARLDPGSTDVVYAHSCWFRGHWTPHLVVRTAQGPVTVLVLRTENVVQARHFAGDGYFGTLVPFGGGSLAVLGQTTTVVNGDVLQRLANALHWLS